MSSLVLSVLLVAYNSRHDIEACLSSLQLHITVPFEVILVDNGSSDDTVSYVREKFSWVRIFESPRNLGFTGGNNLGARQAAGKYLLLLNCDTVLLTDVVAGIQILENDPLVGIVGARMYGRDGEVRPSTGHFPSPWRLWKFSWQWSQPLASPYGRPELSAFSHDWVEGSFLLTPRELWFAIDGMDENAFMYGEDLEFCAHALQQGRRTVMCSKLMYIHYGGYTDQRMQHGYAGYRRFHYSCSSKATRVRADAVLLTGLLARILIYGALACITQKPAVTEKFRQFRHVFFHWNATAPKPSTRRPHQTPNQPSFAK